MISITDLIQNLIFWSFIGLCSGFFLGAFALGVKSVLHIFNITSKL